MSDASKCEAMSEKRADGADDANVVFRDSIVQIPVIAHLYAVDQF